jgi:hypothetical protein
MPDEQIISDLKKNILDFMRHNNYATAKFEIDGNAKKNDVIIGLYTSSKKIEKGKTKKIIKIEYL